MKRLLVLLALSLASGCETAPTPEQIFQSRMNYCAALGFAPGTPEAGNCVLQLHAIDEQRRATLGAAIISSGRLSPPRPVQCYTVGGYTSCH